MKNERIIKLTMSGLLIAIGIIIPIFSPIKILIPPASYTLASHVAIFIAMFISPAVAVSVAVGTTFGFLMGGFPIEIVLRAATHVIFAFLGALYLHRMINEKPSPFGLRIFSFVIAIIHAAAEVIVISFFYFGGNLSTAFVERGYFMSVIMLVGFGTIVHSMIDFEIAYIISRPLKKQRTLAEYFVKC
ncbi:MAG: hypothetical protein FWC09_04190 [Lachnospiraceae bacterium]|nr:hypothetical protein [Lachnospiraceae bacterium]